MMRNILTFLFPTLPAAMSTLPSAINPLATEPSADTLHAEDRFDDGKRRGRLGAIAGNVAGAIRGLWKPRPAEINPAQSDESTAPTLPDMDPTVPLAVKIHNGEALMAQLKDALETGVAMAEGMVVVSRGSHAYVRRLEDIIEEIENLKSPVLNQRREILLAKYDEDFYPTPRIQFISTDGENRVTLDNWRGHQIEIGREEGMGLGFWRIPGDKISSLHAGLTYHDGMVFITDARSKNGTYINGEKIPADLEIPLAEGDMVQFGDQQFIVSDGASLNRVSDLEIDAAALPDVRLVLRDSFTGQEVETQEANLGINQNHYPFSDQPIEIFKTREGEIMLVDKRKGVILESEIDASVVPGFGPMNLNQQLVTPFTSYRLSDGDVIGRSYYLYIAFVLLPRSGLLGRLASMPRWRQRRIAALISMAEEFEEVELALQRAAEFKTEELIDSIAQIIGGFGEISIYSLPAELGIQAKVEGLMREKLAELKRRGIFVTKEGFGLKGVEGLGFSGLQKEYHKTIKLETLGDLIKEAADLEMIIALLQNTPFVLLDGHYVFQMISQIETLAYFGEGDMKNFPEVCGLREKISKLVVREVSQLRASMEKAYSMGELMGVLETSGLSTFGGQPMRVLVKKLEAIAGHTSNGIQDLPRLGGLRQKVRDLMEHANLERAVSLSRNGGKILPKEQGLKETIILLDGEEEKLYSNLDSNWEEKLYLVLDRGKPLATLTRGIGIRDRATIFMRLVIQQARVLFPRDMNVSANPFSGERVDADNFETQYRLARMVLNHHAGRPLRGVPTQEEMGIGQVDLRRMVDQLDPKVVTLLRDAAPEQKALLLEAYFGDYQHRDMPSAAQAFRVAALFGLSGLYREVGVTYALENGSWRVNISLGDLGSVREEEHGRFFILHTHPEEYLNAEGEIMGMQAGGHAKGSGNETPTVYLSQASDASRDSRNILFSKQDVEILVKDSARYVALQKSSSAPPATPLYDGEKRVYKNWVVHPLGGSEMHIVMDGGVAKKVVILFSRDRSKNPNENYKYQKEKLLQFIRETLHLEAEIREISYEDFQQSLPFPVF